MADPEPHSASARRLRALAPYLLTALVAIGVSLAVQQLLAPAPLPQPAPTQPAPPQPTARPVASPAPPTTSAALPLPDDRVLAQELIDLRDQGERRAGFLYLLKAEALLRLAEESLLQNNMNEVDRTLLDVDVTFARAYERSADAGRSPIMQLREQLSLIHDDLYVRPEGLDQRLRRLRQNTLSLVDDLP